MPDTFVKLTTTDRDNIISNIQYYTGDASAMTAGDAADAIADVYENGIGTVLNANNVDRVVTFNEVDDTYSLSDQSELVIESNGAHDTTLHNCVHVNVRPIRTFDADIIGDLSDHYSYLYSLGSHAARGSLTATLNLGGSSITNTVPVMIFNNQLNVILTAGAHDPSGGVSFVLCLAIRGSGVTCQKCFIEQNGTVTDLTSNAGSIISDIELILAPFN